MKILPLYDSGLLFRQLAEGKESAFRQIFDLYRKRLQYLAVKMLKVPASAEEIVQDIFMEIWINKSKFAEIDDPEAYVFTIAYNRIYTQLKKTANEHKLLTELLYFLQNERLSADDLILANESKAIIDEAIESLPPQRKLVFKLSREEGMTHQEIATHLNLSRNTVRNHIIEALRDIRHHLRHTALAILLMMGNNS